MSADFLTGPYKRNPLDIYGLRQLVKNERAYLHAVAVYCPDNDTSMWAVSFYPGHGGRGVALGYIPVPYTEDDIAALRAKIMLVVG